MRPIRVPRTTTARLLVPRRSSFAALLGTRCTGARRQQILRPVCCVCSGHLSGVKNRIACATWLCTYAPPSITPPEPSTIPPAFLFPNPTPTWGDIFGGGPRCLSRRASPPPWPPPATAADQLAAAAAAAAQLATSPAGAVVVSECSGRNPSSSCRRRRRRRRRRRVRSARARDTSAGARPTGNVRRTGPRGAAGSLQTLASGGALPPHP